METIQELTAALESSKQDKRRIGQRIRHAIQGDQPLQLYIGSCPDYTNDGHQYTFEGIGSGVPLLSKKQLAANRGLVGALDCLWRTF